MNYRVTLGNYTEDKYYPKVVRAFSEIMVDNRTVKAVDVFKSIGVLSEQNYKQWKEGKVGYLEKVIECNLGKANRILSIIGFHAHDLNMGKSHSYEKYKGKNLRFSKSGNPKTEELYARQFYIVGKKC